MLSWSNTMNVTFRTGKHARGTFSCEAQGKLMDWYGEVTTTTTTVAPPPPYLGIASEQVDSSEHGGPLGPKSTNCHCGWANKHKSRIVNGVETRANEFPFMVAVIDTFRGSQFCGGSLISAYHVLTAAHCTYKHLISGRSISVVIGDHNLYRDDETNATRTIEVVRIVQHLEYNAWSLKNDISLLVLGERVEFNKLVGPVCLSKVQLEIPTQYVTIIGWGNLRWQGSSPDVLQKVHVRVVHRSSCSEVFFLVDDINPTQICTYASAKASCQGDSGGPVVWLDPETNRYVQVGLVSFGTVCADTNPTVHTDVTAYYDWIQDSIKETMPQETCSKIP
uniref:Venom S1 protease 24 n=1 Tax=Lethocerus distinctifemur TaxID=280095 RepID=A0A2K8JTY9_9HEMI|nr:venom S1 protease 24 [Lethocerus distinctifemur]